MNASILALFFSFACYLVLHRFNLLFLKNIQDVVM